jgi:hypothetical protein
MELHDQPWGLNLRGFGIGLFNLKVYTVWALLLLVPLVEITISKVAG